MKKDFPCTPLTDLYFMLHDTLNICSEKGLLGGLMVPREYMFFLGFYIVKVAF